MRCSLLFTRQVVAIVYVLVIGACSRDDNDNTAIREYSQELSPDSLVSAAVYHYDSPSGGMTQVTVDYVGRGCGSGSASWNEYDIGVELRWIDATTLEVTYPEDKDYLHNASGDLLGCFGNNVRVVMVPRRASDLFDGAYSTPIENGHTPSPDQKISAYLFRYDSPRGGVAQVVVNFVGASGCADSAVTFYDYGSEIQLDWIDTSTLVVAYPENQRYDLPPWGTTVHCVDRTVQVQMRPASHENNSSNLSQ